ncbi:MAG: lipoate--protein ligase family protein [Anaerolineales bacterium]|nr:lipoate--protein ligase family protein [Anaerolineales bacterium]
MERWRLIYAPPANGAWNMAADEALLEHIHRGESAPTLRLYNWTPPCLSLGRAQSFKDADLARLREHGWQVVRRLTGGRAILHADELTYSVAAPEENPILIGGILESYNRLAQALIYAAQKLGLAVEVKERAGAAPNLNPVCFEVPSAYEITVGGKKLIGSAQARSQMGVLQHGSLPLTGDLSRICEALTFTSESARAAAKERLLERATTVESVLGAAVAWEAAAEAFVEGFEAQLGIQFERGEMSASEMQRAQELVQEKYAHPSWTERA